MILTHWKMMAGVLAVSLGGLAAMAGQCTKSEPMKGSPPEMPTASAPVVTPVMPPPATPVLPSIPSVDSSKAGTAPAMFPVIPASGTLPPSPAPVSPPSIPVDATPVLPVIAKPETPAPAPPEATIPTPSVIAPTTGSAASAPMTLPSDPSIDLPAATVKPLAAGGTTGNTTAAVTASAKYRILLRVGEGEPIFEVRSGDDLMLKVVCEKVDVKSPEKGSGLSSVRACGKVRFAGFGAEGTCDELNFLAGTGEVAMTGHVQIRVKDKLGRVESELSAETMRYRIDPHAITGNGLLKP